MKGCFSLIKRWYSFDSGKPKICIVGAGPAAFYAAQQFVKQIPSSQVDIYEKLPVPFGLVRFGVAPDHPEVKNVINTFTKTAENPNVRFLGNVELGKDVFLKQLQEAYNAVLLTYGAEENRKLNIPGENLPNVLPARRIVGWYNGVPSDKNLKLDLTGQSVAIFGQGNVAVDVARIFLTPIDQLKLTDITQHALEALSASKINKVYLIGRRGPLQAAFTIKELREMLKIKNCATIWKTDDFKDVRNVVESLKRPRKRITELMLKSAEETKENYLKQFVPMFFRSPIELIGEKTVEQVKLCVNVLKGDDLLRQEAIATNVTEILDCDLAVTSIGYKSVAADPDIPFDTKKGVAVNTHGKISDGLYASGWLSTGPTGVILTTMSNAFGTADAMCKEILQAKPLMKPGFEHVRAILNERNVQIVTWNDWLKIDKFEKEEGKKLGKPREKILCVDEMLRIAS